MRALGKVIRSSRLRQRKSLRAVASAVGKTHAWLKNLEDGEMQEPKSEDLTAIANELGDDPAEYLRLAGRVNLAANHLIPARDDQPEWARRLEKKIDDLNELLATVRSDVLGSATGVGSILAALNPDARQPGGTRGAQAGRRTAAPRRPAPPASAGMK